jgi:hypothetical protein
MLAVPEPNHPKSHRLIYHICLDPFQEIGCKPVKIAHFDIGLVKTPLPPGRSTSIFIGMRASAMPDGNFGLRTSISVESALDGAPISFVLGKCLK